LEQLQVEKTKTENTALQLSSGVVVILGTGGTIAGQSSTAGDNVGYVAGQVSAEQLVAGIPMLASQALEVEQVAQINSKDMTFAVWQRLTERLAFHLGRPEVCAVVVTHGTDTLEETAFFLDRMLQPTKPVVLTCAMRPATALVPDGPQNLFDAVSVARHVGLSGVVVVCAGQIHGALDVAKVHTYRVNAFDSGEAGPLGCVEEGRVRQFRAWPAGSVSAGGSSTALARLKAARALPRVELVTSVSDADGESVNALLAYAGKAPLRGIVVAGTGNGTLHHELEAALQRASERGIRVVVASRCAQGRVIPHAGQAFQDSRGLSAVKARLALALELLEN
jgi:L-asparaginase